MGTKVALMIERESKIFAPVDTGRLRASIHTEMEGELVWKVCTNVYYAIYQEFGTRKMKAHPFMRPAVAVVKHALPGMLKSVTAKVA